MDKTQTPTSIVIRAGMLNTATLSLGAVCQPTYDLAWSETLRFLEVFQEFFSLTVT